MFHKEHSSTADQGGKKGKDVALRKSDRKVLLQTALSVLNLKNENDDDSSACMMDAASAAASRLLLEDVFLRGTLLKRSLKLPTGNASLYFRSPSSSSDCAAGAGPSGGCGGGGSVITDASSSSSAAAGSTTVNATTTTVTAWPYAAHPQCVWLQVEPERNAVYEVPGLALLSVLPFVPAVVNVPSQVSKYICRGAHLMRAGMRNVPTVTTNHNNTTGVVAVCVQGNPQPFGVGILHPDLLIVTNNNNNNSSVVGVGCKGTGVTVIHAYGDDVWRQQVPHNNKKAAVVLGVMNQAGGAMFDAGHYGNVGFVDGQYVVPIHAVPDDEDENDENNDEQSEEAEMDAVSTDAVEATELDASHVETEDVATEQDDPPPEMSDDLPPEADAQETSCSPDEILHDAVCKALASLSLKKDLPMTMATFYAQHVLPNRSATIQLKQTKYKKFSAYIREQVEAGLIMAGPDTKTKDALGTLTGYERKHKDLVEYIADRKAAAAEGDDGSTNNKRLVLADLYCISNHFVALLRLDRDTVKATEAASIERRGTGMLTAKEVWTILEDYITREELVVPERPELVQLDGPLTDALYKKKKKQGNDTASSDYSAPTTLSRKDITTLWLACQEPAYALVQVPGNAILKLGRGKPPVVTIEVSRRQSNKFVTRVVGLEPFGVDAAAFSKDAAYRFACASSVTPPATTHGHAEVLLQGNLADELEALLLSDESLTSHGGAKGSTYFLPKNSIDVVLRKGVPARKKRNTGSKNKK